MQIDTGKWEDARVRLQEAQRQFAEARVELERAEKVFNISFENLKTARIHIETIVNITKDGKLICTD